ncbi:Receptor-like protein 12 [Linum perenne]
MVEWNASTDCCEWPGISCDHGGLGRVISLDLSFEDITGGEGLDDSTALFSLRYLEHLDLSFNEFNTTIPAAIGNLTNLRYLDLSYARFFGKIPNSISQLTSLISLNLSCWDCDKKLEIANLALLVQNLTQLTDLRLNGVDLSSQRKDWCHVLSSSLPNLKVLSLLNCSLSGPIDPSISKLQSLSKLLLNSNNFSSQIPDSLAELKNLTYLSLSNCRLIGTFPKKIAQSLTLLEYLDLSNNHLQGPIPRSLSELPSLYTLYLSSNRFRGSVQLSWFQTLQNLKWFDLSYNNLTVDASINNSSPSSTFPQLETLGLESCNLRTFPELGNLSELSELDLSDNNINGLVPRWIMESTTLVHLNLSHNNLVGFEVHRFSSRDFEVFDMHDNQFEGNLPFIPSSSYIDSYIDFSHNHFSGSFPTEFFNNQYFRAFFLSLSNNRFTGIIPTSICNLANLEVVDFSNNYFNGTIPSCLSKDLNGLSVLDLRGNMLSGNIPNTFQVSCALQTLDLSNNQLEGKFPKSLENCTNLEVLDVGYNKISDVFPCIQGIKSSLHVLILRNNLFHGSLWCRYGDLTTWKQLQIVDLAFNNFSGPLNDKFLLTWEAMMQDRKETNDIIHFETRNSGEYYRNSITVSMKGLELELVKILTIFKSIDLSSNNFDGPIPEVIGKFKAIQVLNLSHNAFSGEIPSEFGNLSNVESLDLSHNKLTGKIPNELTGLTFLSCMDLSDNNLVGRIPTGSQFQLFDNTSFEDNPDLCGQPLSKSCTDPPAPPSIIVNHEKASIRINWDILSKGWNVSTDCCEWPGISCDLGGLGRVIGLDLSFERITRGGGLGDSTALFSLRYLERLDLSYNRFNTTIPAAIGNLTNLRYLDLSHASFFGKIPTSISQLTSLTSLNLSCLYCDPRLKISNLGLLVQNLTQLIDLRLNGTDLSAEGKEWGHVLSSSLPNLKVLSLANCSLSGPLDPSISKLQSLSILELDDNNFSSPIPNSLAELKNLTLLRLTNCELIGTFPKKIVESLTLLETLDLSNNQLHGPIPRSIFELPSLRVIFLSSNRFRGSVQLSRIHTLQNLTWLDLSDNNLTVDASINSSSPSFTFPQLEGVYLRSCNLRTFPELGNLTKLQNLDLSDNNINGVVPRWIMESTTLEYLNLSHNNLVGFEVHHFSSYYFAVFDMHDNQFEGNLPFIPSPNYLDISHNHFSGSFPTEIFNNRDLYLSFLSLSNNRLTGTIPTSICNHAGLEVVDFSNNYFNGTIPSCLSKDLNHLSVLDLRGNMFSGNIPNTFQVSCALQTLDLSNNQLEGKFPKSLENCTNLEVLDIGYNKISDVFPCIQGIKSSLHVLILRNNLFHGSLWCSYDDSTIWQQLQIVDLAFNNFSGPLNDKFFATWEAMIKDGNETHDFIRFQPSVYFGYYQDSIVVSTKGLEWKFEKILTIFKSIDLSSNNFHGPIPEIIGKFKALHVLNLSHNAFTGNIPSVIGDLSNLESLDLSHNKLSGHIPMQLAGLTFLAVMNLSDNYLVGSIPTGKGLNVSTDCCEWPGISCDLGGLGRVIGLDLSFEEITGGEGLDDSTALFSLRYLERLDLSYNKFNTTIPAAIGNLTNLRYLNLSCAGFFGKIPTSISQLTNLTSLRLSCPNCNPKLKISNLTLLVQNLTQLTELGLDGVDLSSQRKEWCHVLSSSLPNLKVLSLSNCSLSGPIDPSFSKLQSLSILELDYNNFSSIRFLIHY